MPPTPATRPDYFRWLALLGCLAGAALCVVSLVSCASLQRTVMVPPEVPGATFVGNKVCADCHQEYTRLFAGSPHARVHLEVAALAGQTGCESCHGPGSLHVQQPAARDRIVNPRKDAGTCFQCHVQTHAEFNLPQHHPLPEGKMNCVQCHDPHGFDIRKPAGGLGFARVNQGCAECHREQARPFVYEHEVMRDGCTACHQPHGSVNRAMLTQPDNNLCLRCHAQTPGPFVATGGGEIYIGKEDHTFHLQRGGCWTSGCHSAVHGSNISPRLRY